MENQPYFNWITDVKLRNQLADKVICAKSKRGKESQKEVALILSISLTKIKEIEKGICKDFNAINNYINYFQESLL